MSWVAVDKDGVENICSEWTHFERVDEIWVSADRFGEPLMELPRGSVEKLIGRKLTWEDEPVELKEEKEEVIDYKKMPYIKGFEPEEN